MSEHTPGPWHARLGAGAGYRLTDKDDHAIVSEGLITPALVWGGASFEEGEANAHLIAAAPDMLAALKLAQDIIGHPDDSGSKLIAEVIAKAEGNTP